jgi:predicted transcriptional regulator
MNSTPEPPKTVTELPRPDLRRLASALSHPTRWKMLQALSDGEPRTIAEMAQVTGCSYDNAFKHLVMLRRAGLAVQRHGRLYEVPKAYLPVPGQPVVDCGRCLLRLDAMG